MRKSREVIELRTHFLFIGKGETIYQVCILRHSTSLWIGVATISRLLKIIGLFCKRPL